MNARSGGPVAVTKRKKMSVLRKLLITFAVLVLLGLLWVGYAWRLMNGAHSSVPASASDVGIILGASMWGDSPSPGLRERLDEGLRLYQEGKFPHIIVTGGLDRADYKYTEAEGMRNYLVDHGVPASAIILENKATSTYENLLFSREIMRERGWQSAVIVTHQYHGMRSLDIAKFLDYTRPALGLTESRTLQMKYHKPREVLAYTKWKLDELLLLTGLK